MTDRKLTNESTDESNKLIGVPVDQSMEELWKFEIVDQILPKHTQLCKDIQWGTRGVTYTMPDVAEVILKDAKDNSYAIECLTTTENKLIGVVLCFKHRPLVLGSQIDAHYVSLFAVVEEMRGKKLGFKMLEQGLQYLQRTVGTTPTLIWGLIEGDNDRSLHRANQMNSQPIRQLKPFTAAWEFPSLDKNVELLIESEREGMIKLLTEAYTDHSIIDFNAVKSQDRYVVYRSSKDNTITAGCYIMPIKMQFQQFKSKSDEITYKTLSRWSWLTPLFKPGLTAEPFTFSLIYAKLGHEKDLMRILETYQALGYSWAMSFYDPGSSVAQRIIDTCNNWRTRGILADIIESGMPKVCHVQALTINMTPEQIVLLFEKPSAPIWHGY